jgi:hypothetical protein
MMKTSTGTKAGVSVRHDPQLAGGGDDPTCDAEGEAGRTHRRGAMSIGLTDHSWG